MNRRIMAILVLIVSFVIVNPVRADGIIIIDPPPQPPPDWNAWLTIRYHRVTVSIVNQVATTKVDQVFCNDGPIAVEGVYIFPIPPEAVVQSFVMWIDGQPIEGEILPADEARDIYESYVRRQRDPALLEYVGRDAVRVRIFPIPTGEERRIQLEYTQVIPAENGLAYYRYPLNTERFSNLPLEQVSIHVDIESQAELRAIYSPSHQNDIVITRHGSQRATISYEASNILPTRDFELYIGTTIEDIGINLLTYQAGAEDGFFLLMLTPALETETHHVIPRDIVLVLDTSGSMDGEKLEQAKQALIYILDHLNPADRFNVVAFSSDVRAYARNPQPVQDANQAIDWVRGLEALGGTNIYLALSEALAQTDPDRPAVVILLTDGLPTEGIVEEQTLLSTLAQEAPTSARIFPFGVGYDVNTLFLDQLAQDHKGRSAYVEPHERIDENVSSFYARIQSPLLTNVSLDFGGVRTYDLYPNPLPDLYAGTQLVVTGRFTGSGRPSIRLTGEVEGQRQVYTYEGSFTARRQADFIPRLWAARKIGYLLTQIRLHGENREWIEAVVTLSLRYGIITPYTSFLVEEPGNVLTSEGRDRASQEFIESLNAAPLASSGEKAVEDAKMRQDLGAAEAPPTAGGMLPTDSDNDNTPSRNSVRYAGEKTFLCEADICTDTLFVPNQMTPYEVVFMSETYWKLLEEHPEFAVYFSIGEESFFVTTDGAAYHFRLGTDTEAVPRPETPTKQPISPTATPTFTPDNQPEARQAAGHTSGLCGSAIALSALGTIVAIQSRRRKQTSSTSI